MPFEPDRLFLLSPATPGDVLTGTSHPGLVLLSILVAMLASGMALHLAACAGDSPRRLLRIAALATGSVALGVGVWAMHFIGMLAFQLCTTVRYDPVVTIASMLPSLGAACVALWLASRKRLSGWQLLGGGVMMGAGIGLMHYCGMAAMRMQALLRYDPVWFAISIVVAVVLAVAALWIRFGLRRGRRLTERQATVLSGIVMGLAISGMHYTAMNAARFIGRAEPGFEPRLGQNLELAAAVAIATLLISLAAVAIHAALRYRQVFQDLVQSRARLQAVVDTAIDGVISLNAHGEITAFNRAAESIFGWTAAEAVGMSLCRLIPRIGDSSDETAGDLCVLRRVLMAGSDRETQGVRKDGTNFPLRIAIGEALHSAEALLVAFVTDISDRKAIEEALTKSERQHRSLVANLPGVAFRSRVDAATGTASVVFVSDGIEALTGWKAAELLSGELDLDALVHPDDRHRASMRARRHDRQSNTYQIEYRIVRRDGVERWVSERGTVSPETDRRQAWIDGIVVDITESRLRNAEFEGVVTAIHRALPVIEFTLDGTIRHVNDNFLALTGHSAAELLGHHHRVLCFPEEAATPDYAAHWAALRNGEFRSGEFKRVGKNGKQIWIHATYNPILDADGRPSRIIKFVSDLTERHVMEQDLRRAKERAEQGAAAKSTFLTNMSHEIRTPMNAIIGFTEVLLESDLGTAQRTHLQTIHRSARSLLSLLNDILDAAKLDHGAVALEQHDFSLRQLCGDLLATLRLSAENKGLALVLDYPDAIGDHFVGDSLRLQQVLVNLLGNAVKFTSQGSVRLEVRSTTQGLDFAVVDTGIGIPADRLDRIFDPFAQADASMTRRFGGTGLGTTIARQLVELMGGRIGVESTVGTGSRFRFTLPLRSGRAVARREAPTLPTLLPLRILVADDVPENVDLLVLRLGQLGHSVITAANGEAAVAMAQAEHPDVVVMDVQMPQLNGLDATRRLRAWEAATGRAPMPVIALTASVLEEDRRETMEAGMTGFAVKPVDLPQLVTEIARVTGRALDMSARKATDSPDVTPPHRLPDVDEAAALARWGSAGLWHAQVTRFLDANLRDWPAFDEPDATGAAIAASTAFAHRLRGAAANLGLRGIAATAARLEAAKDALDVAGWQGLHAEVEELRGRFGMHEAPPASRVVDVPALTPDERHELSQRLRRGQLREDLLKRVLVHAAPSMQQRLDEAIANFDFDLAANLLEPLEAASR